MKGVKILNEQFINKAKIKHGNKFDYSLVKYINANTKVKIICPKHGIIEIAPKQHLLYDCVKCSGKGKLSKNELIEQFNKVHQKIYDYSLIEYKNDRTKIKIICPKHGMFEQQPNAHKNGQGCPKCARERINFEIKKRLLSNNDFIKRIEEIFGKNLFIYSKLEYKGAHIPVSLICKKCKNVETKAPTVWYEGFGCLICQGNRKGPKGLTNERFIELSKNTHNDRYNYSKTKYTKSSEKVEIICSKHGSFFQVASTHINAKCGCPECSISKGEEKIGIWLNKNNINYIFQHQVKIGNSYHYYDFYLPKHNIIIEYNGMQHYKPIKFFGGQKGFDYLKERDNIKKEYCQNQNIKLIIISYKDNIEETLNQLK